MKNHLSRLKKQAIESTDFRGHQMHEWADMADGKSAFTNCDSCGMNVSVNTNPMPNSIDIGGEAVALTCTSPLWGDVLSSTRENLQANADTLKELSADEIKEKADWLGMTT